MSSLNSKKGKSFDSDGGSNDNCGVVVIVVDKERRECKERVIQIYFYFFLSFII